MARGGKREGAGRKKGSIASHTLRAQVARQGLIEMYLAEREEVDGALITKAKTGDVPAIRELYDRVHGKAPQETRITGKDGKDINEPSEAIKKLAADLLKLHNG